MCTHISNIIHIYIICITRICACACVRVTVRVCACVRGVWAWYQGQDGLDSYAPTPRARAECEGWSLVCAGPHKTLGNWCSDPMCTMMWHMCMMMWHMS
jgi:hypothetical protein